MNANGTCRSCGAAIVWTVTDAGKRMPVDVIPREWPTGRIVLRVLGSVVQSSVARERPEEGNCYVSHYATCPQAANWRRKEAR